MEITVMTKAKYDALLAQIKHLEDCIAFTQNQNASIKNLETQIAFANAQIKAIQESNNQLAEIAFDESKFTTQLMDKVWDTAERAAKDAINDIDIDDIAREVAQVVDFSDEVERHIERLDIVSEDKVSDMIQDHINDNNILNSDEVEEVVSEYVERNCDFVEKDVTDQLHDDIQELKQNIHAIVKDEVNKALQTLINKLTAKENDHATGNHDYSLQVSGTSANSEGSSDAAAAA